MTAITFSHEYIKMPEKPTDQIATLLEVFNVRSKEDLSKEFLNYDTKFLSYNYFAKSQEERFYPLPNGELIVLLLMIEKQGEKPFLFTTIRRKTPEKEIFYKHLRGEKFNIRIIKEDR